MPYIETKSALVRPEFELRTKVDLTGMPAEDVSFACADQFMEFPTEIGSSILGNF
jgi:hypothetical protein